jgi:hypothetical protein
MFLCFYQNPNEIALSIGKHAPIPSQTAVTNPRINVKLAIGRRNGFWNLFTFSMNGTVINPTGTAAIANTPNNLFGNTRNKLNVGKKYHSGKISKGVLNGSAGSPICVGAKVAKPTQHANKPNIVKGKMYKRSFGHAGSP